MFVMLLRYTKPLEDVDRVLPAHKAFIDRYYAEGNFIFTGRQNPRVGGVIICKADTREQAEEIARADPFAQEGVAEYTIIEFSASRCAPGLENLIG